MGGFRMHYSYTKKLLQHGLYIGISESLFSCFWIALTIVFTQTGINANATLVFFSVFQTPDKSFV